MDKSEKLDHLRFENKKKTVETVFPLEKLGCQISTLLLKGLRVDLKAYYWLTVFY